MKHMSALLKPPLVFNSAFKFFFQNRFLSSALKVHSLNVDKNVQLRSLEPVEQGPSSRPLVIVIGWMLISPKNLHKLGNIYLERGCDVLGVQVRPLQVLLPTRAKEVADNILKYVESFRSNDAVLVHGFSVGGYIYGELLSRLNENTNPYPQTRSNLSGQIFDSPADISCIPRGFARVLLKNVFLQNMVETLLTLYLKAFTNSITRQYLLAQSQFFLNKLKVPSMILYSTADPITDEKVISDVIDKWLANDITVFTKCWQDSGHVQHYLFHKEEYVQQIDKFLVEINLKDKEDIMPVKVAYRT